MGLDLFGDGCTGVWESSRDAIVSDQSKLPAAARGYGNRATAPPTDPPAGRTRRASREEMALVRAAVVDGSLQLVGNQTAAQVNRLLREYGEPALPQSSTLSPSEA